MKNKTTLLITFLLAAFSALVAQPSNDDCNGAITLTSNTSCSSTNGTVANATADNFPNQATCDAANPSLGAGVFYKFTAAATTETITVTPTGTLDAIIVLYSGGCFNLSQVGCIDQPGGNGVVTSLTVNGLTVGTQYIIRVYDYGAANATSGGFTICVTHQCQAAPPTGIDADASICQSATAMHFIGATGATPSNWHWYSGSCGGTPVGTGDHINVSEATPGSVTYYVRAENSCGNSNCLSTTLTIVATPPAPSPTVSPNPVCSGSDFTLNANVTGTSYEWYNPNNNSFTNSHQQNPVVSGGIAGQYSLSYQQNGCWSNDGFVTVTINSTPGNPIVLPTSGCSPLSISASSNNCNNCSYQWSTPTGGANGNSVTASTSGNYTVTASSNGCTATSTTNINVTPQPNSPTFSGNLTGTGSVTITASSSNCNSCSYNWSYGTNGATANLASSGTYTVTATNNGCSATASVTVTVNTGTGINQLTASDFTISPNPSAGTFNISFETTQPEQIEFRVFNSTGQLVKEETPVKVSGAYTKQINLGNAPTGIYLLQIKTANGQTINKQLQIQ